MLFFIITVREEVFPEIYCWALEECTTQALRRAGWSAEPWVQKVVRLPPAEFTYHSGANPTASAVAPSKLRSRRGTAAPREAGRREGGVLC